MEIKFDKIQIITSSRYISDIDNEKFTTVTKDGCVEYQRFKQTTPFDLIICVNKLRHELLIEFTSKILLENFELLISSRTIRNCFDNINNMGICRLDVDRIMCYSKVTKLDITKDVPFDISTFPSLLDDIRQSVKNYNRWNCNIYPAKGESHGIVFQNVVSNRKYRKRLTIYAKYLDLCKSTNRSFMRELVNADEVMERFRNVLRFELNVYTMAQIRNYLNIDNNDLMTVLEADIANPIATILDDILEDYLQPVDKKMTIKQRGLLALIKECGWDKKRVEFMVRESLKPNQAISRAMRPFNELFALLKPRQNVKEILLSMVA